MRNPLQVDRETETITNGTAKSDRMEALLADRRTERRLFDITISTYNTQNERKLPLKPPPVNANPD